MSNKTTPPTPTHHDPGKQLIEWLANNRRTVLLVAAAVATAALVVWFVLEYQERKELAATNALNEARVAIQSENLPLAASDLSRLVTTYGGTVAADEAIILLAQVRLQQAQPAVAAEELRQALDRGLQPQFRADALGLLGTALEQIGNYRDAAQTFERAAEAAWYPFLAAQYLSDAGRAFLVARDTVRAVAAYETILEQYEDAPVGREARVRLAELRAAMGG